MTDEIIHTWKDEETFIGCLTLEPVHPVHTAWAQGMNRKMEFGPETVEYDFRLIDGRGESIVFPTRLVSNTTVHDEAPAHWREEAIPTDYAFYVNGEPVAQVPPEAFVEDFDVNEAMKEVGTTLHGATICLHLQFPFRWDLENIIRPGYPHFPA